MSDVDALLGRIDRDLDAARERLFAWLRIPSISADPAHAKDCRQAAGWLRDELAGLGFSVNRRAKLTPDRRPKLTPLLACTAGSARPGGTGRGCGAGASAVA